MRDRKYQPERFESTSILDGNQARRTGGVLYKDFGSFKLCGEGKYPKTFLLAGQPALGRKL